MVAAGHLRQPDLRQGRLDLHALDVEPVAAGSGPRRGTPSAAGARTHREPFRHPSRRGRRGRDGAGSHRGHGAVAGPQHHVADRSSSPRRRSRPTCSGCRSASRRSRGHDPRRRHPHRSDAALLAPNVHFTEFSARKLSFVRLRGIGSSPANPGVTTYIDGVPQLNDNTSSIDLLDVERIEFVRGPQSALFGRNTLGGLVNVVTERPSLDAVDRQRRGAVRQLRGDATCGAGGRPARRQGGGGLFAGTQRSRWLHHQRADGQRSRLPIGNDLQGPGAVRRRVPTGRRASSSPASERGTATTRSTTWGRCATTRSRRPATSRATTIGTSCRRPCWCGMKGSG